ERPRPREHEQRPRIEDAGPEHEGTLAPHIADDDEQNHSGYRARADRREQQPESLRVSSQDIAREDRDERLVVAEHRERSLDREDEGEDRTSAPSTSDVTTDELCVIRRSRRRSTRSATVPPMRASAKMGAARNRPPRPRRNGESVSW